MSRTHNTAPWAVQQNRLAVAGAPRPRARHRTKLERAPRAGGRDIRHHCGHRRWGFVECDAHRVTSVVQGRYCDRKVDGRHNEWDPYYRSARDRSHRYWRPERTAVRNALVRARQEARGGGELDDSLIPVQQHRHATWGGGWWD